MPVTLDEVAGRIDKLTDKLTEAVQHVAVLSKASKDQAVTNRVLMFALIALAGAEKVLTYSGSA